VPAIAVQDLGRLAFEPALAAQRRVHADVLAGRRDETLLIVEHDPVITLGRRARDEHLLAGADLLADQGVAVCRTDRGGDITYHGPGQIVAYPIIRLSDRGLNLREYVCRLEQAVIGTLAAFGINAGRDRDAVGVWVGGEIDSTSTDRAAAGRGDAKIAAIGVRAEKWVTLHGLALNVTTNLDHYRLIVPCGLAGRPVTSMSAILGDTCPPIGRVKGVLVEQLQCCLDSPNMDAHRNGPLVNRESP
jgi:lipoyl(octanoyl) transferase